MGYRYADEDPRPVAGRYFYAPFEGAPFLAAYRAARREAIAILSAIADEAPEPAVDAGVVAPLPVPGIAPVDTRSLLRSLGDPVADPVDAGAWLGVLVRKIELARRLRARYGPDLRPTLDDDAPFEAYARLTGRLVRAATREGAAPDLGLLSTLLKTGDIVCHLARADAGAVDPVGAAIAADALELELALVAAVERRGIPAPGRPLAPLRFTVPATPADRATPDDPRERIVLLAADTARARAYLDLLAGAGRAPDAAIVVTLAGPPAAAAPVRPTPLFDNLTPLPDALERARVPVTRLAVDRLEAPEVLAALAAHAPAIVVVAPPAGVLLAPACFDVPGVRYLHVHPGRVPAYRGSTPMYYSLLAEGRLAASALFLDAGIDTGALVAEREFEPPADLATIDGAFDPWMRAVLLRDVLAAAGAGASPRGLPQPAGGARTFFVIHPVLRHVALLAGRAGSGAPAEDPSTP